MKNGVWDIKDVWEVRKGIMKEKLIITDHLISCAGECVRVEEGEKGILIFGETIVRVEELGSFSSILQEGEREILDMRGNYVLPGLIDGHLHLSFSSSSQPLTELYGDDEETCLLRMVRAALMELKSGVTTVRDCGAKGMGILKLRDFIGKGEMQGPDIISAGMPLTITGGHCNFCGLECDTVSEAVKAVRWLCKQGVDYIKVMVSGGNMTPGSDSLIDQYSEETLKAIVEEAHARGKKVSGHVHSTRSIERAIRAGFDVLDHCSFKGEAGRITDRIWQTRWQAEELQSIRLWERRIFFPLRRRLRCRTRWPCGGNFSRAVLGLPGECISQGFPLWQVRMPGAKIHDLTNFI